MITSKRIDEEMRGVEGLDWISALRNDAIRKLVEQEAFELSLFDEKDLAEITSPDYPGERLIVCRNPMLADKRKHTREELLGKTESKLEEIAVATRRETAPCEAKTRSASEWDGFCKSAAWVNIFRLQSRRTDSLPPQ